MSVIAELQVPSADFELGRILAVERLSTIELESLVPVEAKTVPLFWIRNSTRDRCIESVKQHPAVNSVDPVDVFDDRTLFALDWDADSDSLFRAIRETNGQLLSAVGARESWEFELRFGDHEALSQFTDACLASDVSIEAKRIYNPTKPDAGP
jgi:hypothetical protein